MHTLPMCLGGWKRLTLTTPTREYAREGPLGKEDGEIKEQVPITRYDWFPAGQHCY
jgi:hypothetical protein